MKLLRFIRLISLVSSCHGLIAPRLLTPLKIPVRFNNLKTVGGSTINVIEPFGKGLMNDIKSKAPFYLSDWKDGLNLKSLSSTFFLFFACIAPAVVSIYR